MNIPDKAVEAAVRALIEDCQEPDAKITRLIARAAVEAAAPFIAAQTLRDEADEQEKLNGGVTSREAMILRSFRVRALRLRADELGPS